MNRWEDLSTYQRRKLELKVEKFFMCLYGIFGTLLFLTMTGVFGVHGQ